jgi:hypothetical protein
MAARYGGGFTQLFGDMQNNSGMGGPTGAVGAGGRGGEAQPEGMGGRVPCGLLLG